MNGRFRFSVVLCALGLVSVAGVRTFLYTFLTTYEDGQGVLERQGMRRVNERCGYLLAV